MLTAPPLLPEIAYSKVPPTTALPVLSLVRLAPARGRFEGYSRFDGMICLGWLGLYQES
jgi:hypothetical protein